MFLMELVTPRAHVFLLELMTQRARVFLRRNFTTCDGVSYQIFGFGGMGSLVKDNICSFEVRNFSFFNFAEICSDTFLDLKLLNVQLVS